MISSTVALFGPEVDASTLDSYREQVIKELDDLRSLTRQHDVPVPLEVLEEAARSFAADPTEESAKALDLICHDLIEWLGSQQPADG